MGGRIRAVSREIAFEHIDVIRYDTNPAKYAINAFSPAKVLDAERRPEDGTFVVHATAEAFPVALGKGGVNVRLVERLLDAKVELVQVEEGQPQAAPTREAGETHEESTNL